jgi:cell pole-organizing protein PopZ
MTTAPPPAPAPDGPDPSMEEILASIRRILNDDEPGAVAEDANGQIPPDDDVLVLDESMMVLAAEDVGAEHIGAEAATPVAAPPNAAPPNATMPEYAEPAAAAEPPAMEMEVLTSTPQADPRDQSMPTPDLLGPEAAAAASISVGSLMRTLAAGRATQVYAGGPTLEDLVRAELRPLLKEWLDTNLPPVVERLVRAEIERVVGRAVP